MDDAGHCFKCISKHVTKLKTEMQLLQADNKALQEDNAELLAKLERLKKPRKRKRAKKKS